jgi:dihydropyrimidinase
MDLAVRNGKVVIPGVGVVEAEIGVENGKIARISKTEIEAEQKIDAKGKYVIPGVIDPHIHLGIFAPFEKECEFETRSAIAGGVTTVGCFFGGGGSYFDVFPQAVKEAEKHIYTDIFFHLVIGDGTQLEEMKSYAAEFGVTSFKFYMAGIPGIIDPVSDGFMLKAFRKIAEMGYPAIGCVHAENASLIEVATEDVRMRVDDGSLEDWEKTHPGYVEEEAIDRAAYIANLANSRIYIVHLSSKEGLNAVKRAKRYGNFFVETTSPYLSLTKHESFGLLGLMVPPFRGREDVDALWTGVKQGLIDSFGTDNVSMTRETKSAEKGMWSAMPGYPFLATHLPVLLHEGLRRRVPIETLVEKMSKNPAEIFGLYPRKGTISVGSDADLVIVDVKGERKVNHEDLHSYSDFSLLDGRTLRGWPVVTVRRGEVVMEDNEILAKKGTGSYLRRNLG